MNFPFPISNTPRPLRLREKPKGPMDLMRVELAVYKEEERFLLENKPGSGDSDGEVEWLTSMREVRQGLSNTHVKEIEATDVADVDQLSSNSDGSVQNDGDDEYVDHYNGTDHVGKE